MDKHTLQILEFGRVLESAASYAATDAGREAILDTGPLGDPREIARKSGLISECRTLLAEGRASGIEHFSGLRHLFKRIKPEDSVLEPLELRSFLPLLYSAINLKSFEKDNACPGLSGIISNIITHPHLCDLIEGSIDNEGRVRDTASRELAAVRRGIRSGEERIRKALDSILKEEKTAPYLQDRFIAERNNRFVIPVKIDAKGSVPGVLHDISNTGETVYIEPYSIQRLGNELESFRAEEKLEVHRILRRISRSLREERRDITRDHDVVAMIDALWSFARMSEKMDMTPPEINEDGFLRIVKGRHPLLWTALSREKKEDELVPLDIETGRDHTTVVITGSNAGGKTVALKTIGIIQLMALSGMHVPAGSGTTVPMLDNVFADIGDEQSIENNLSTFSAHITRISEILERSARGTLVIIDELGTGTDPEQGGALSCAILRRLKERGALTVVSTHLGILKAFAHSEPGITNSSMEMEETVVNNIPSFKPTYKLVIGEPGTSHAFEIAESLGLRKDIITEARESLAGEGAKIESLITELKHQRTETGKRLREAEELRRAAERERRRLERELSDLRSKKQDVMSRALADAEELLRRTKTEARDHIKQLKRSRPAETARVIKEIDRKHEEVRKELEAQKPEKTVPLKDARAGQHVYINALGIHGTVSSVDGRTGKCTVNAGGKEIMIPLGGLSEPFEKSPPGSGEETGSTYTVDTGHVDMEVPAELNVVGERVDPALSGIERYLNDACMSGAGEVRIIHGVGTGRLAAAIRDLLKTHPLVREIRKGGEDEGGEGVTIVKL